MAVAGIVLVSFIFSIAVNKGIRGIEKKTFRGFLLVIAGFAIQLTIFSSKFASSSLSYLTPYLYILSLAVLFVPIALNLKYHGMKITLVGFLSNFLAIVSNGGYMPQDISLLELAGNVEKAELLRTLGKFYNGIAMSNNTKFKFLSDILVVTKPNFLAAVYSIGDVFIAIGLCIFVFELFKVPSYNDDLIEEDYS